MHSHTFGDRGPVTREVPFAGGEGREGRDTSLHGALERPRSRRTLRSGRGGGSDFPPVVYMYIFSTRDTNFTRRQNRRASARTADARPSSMRQVLHTREEIPPTMEGTNFYPNSASEKPSRHREGGRAFYVKRACLLACVYRVDFVCASFWKFARETHPLLHVQILPPQRFERRWLPCSRLGLW